LRDAKPTRLVPLSARAIPPGERLVHLRCGKDRLHLPYGECFGQAAAALGAFQSVARIRAQSPLADQETEVGADGGDFAPDRRGAQTQILKQVDEVAEERAG